jgi:hypothetical protein
MADWKALCAELLDALEGYVEYAPVIDAGLKDEQQLVANARTALAQPEPEEPTDENLRALWGLGWQSKDPEDGAVLFAKEVLARWSRPAIEPVPVAERPWEREGWCDEEGKCWFLREVCGDLAWELEDPSSTITFGRISCLPHHALPIPATP